MALIKCQECGNSVSTQAASCPHCGAPIEVKSPSYAGWGCLTLIIVGLIVIISLPSVDKNTTNRWGQIKYVHTPTNIRSARSSESNIVGRLQTNEKVKVDFLNNNWYAVFKPEESIRDSLKALGYIYAPLMEPIPLEQETPQLLKYKVEDKQEALDKQSMTYCVTVSADTTTSKELLMYTARHIWENGNKNWQEFRVYIFLPGMDIDNAAYAVYNFNQEGLKGSIIGNYVYKNIESKNHEETREEQLQKHFSFWDGSHNGLTAYIKKMMNDPDSYKHVETFYEDYFDYLIVRTTYRGKNAFGGVVTSTVAAKVDLNGNVIEVISWFP